MIFLLHVFKQSSGRLIASQKLHVRQNSPSCRSLVTSLPNSRLNSSIFSTFDAHESKERKFVMSWYTRKGNFMRWYCWAVFWFEISLFWPLKWDQTLFIFFSICYLWISSTKIFNWYDLLFCIETGIENLSISTSFADFWTEKYQCLEI